MTSGKEWSGAVGDSWAAQWRATDLSFSELARWLDAAILDVAPETGRAIDIGCGAGATSIALALARPGLQVTGMDLSEGLVATARGRAAGIANLRFDVGDAARIAPGAADLLLSRHGVMFFDDPVAAFTAFREAITPGGALVFSCFRAFELNRWAAEVVSAVVDGVSLAPTPTPTPGPGPFAFADPSHVHAILSASGWRGEERPVDYTYTAGEGDDAVADALAFFGRIGPAARALKTLEGNAREVAEARLRAVLENRLQDRIVAFPAAAWIWSCRPA